MSQCHAAPSRGSGRTSAIRRAAGGDQPYPLAHHPAERGAGTAELDAPVHPPHADVGQTPAAIVTASRQLEDYDVKLDRDISEVGIYTVPEIVPDVSGPKARIEIVEEVVTRLAAPDRLVGLLGGEHSITVGAVTAVAGSHPDISVLYLDAHADLRDEYMGSRWGHASVARRLHEVCPLVEVGVRSLSLGERRFIRDNEIPVVFWPPANGQRLATVIDALTPAVGTPEPGGMSWHDLIGLVRAVARERKIVGFDVTELSPGEGPEAGAFTAAKLVQKVIGYSVPAA